MATGGGPYVPPTPEDPDLESVFPSIVMNVPGAIDSDMFPEDDDDDETQMIDDPDDTNFDDVFSPACEVSLSVRSPEPSTDSASSTSQSGTQSPSLLNHRNYRAASANVRDLDIEPLSPDFSVRNPRASSTQLQVNNPPHLEVELSPIMRINGRAQQTHQTSRSMNNIEVGSSAAVRRCSSIATSTTAQSVTPTSSSRQPTVRVSAIDRELEARLQKLKTAEEREKELLEFQRTEHQARLHILNLQAETELKKQQWLKEKEEREKEAFLENEKRVKESYKEEERRKRELFEIEMEIKRVQLKELQHK